MLATIRFEDWLNVSVKSILVDQRTSEGKKIDFFNYPALTTTIPAQISLKYKCKIVPIRMERHSYNFFEMTIGGETRKMKPGDAYVIPPGVEHSLQGTDGWGLALDVFSPPREEYK